MPGGSRAAGQQIGRLVHFPNPGRGYAMAQERLVALVVARGVEEEQSFLHDLRTPLRPDLGRFGLGGDAHAGQDAGQFLHVGLRVSAAHAQRMQFHQLARVVLVDLAGDILRIVQIDQHGRRAHGGLQQVAELAQRMRADGLVFVLRKKDAHVAFLQVDIEVVHPEPGHLVLQLPVRIQRAPHGALVDLRGPLQRKLAGFAHGFLLFVRRQFFGRGAHVQLGRACVLVGALRDRERVDALLHRRRQLAFGGGAQLRLQVAFGSHLLDAGQLGRRCAPGHAVDQGGFARPVVGFRLSQRGRRQRQQEQGRGAQQAQAQELHGADTLRKAT